MDSTKNPINTTPSRYAAFISYAHKDARWAAWLQQAIETYRLPQDIAAHRGVDRKIGKVFRDRDELTVATSLAIQLNEALNDSDALIVVCSPSAAKSQWVAAEIEYFKNRGKSDRIFCLLIGDPALSFPAGVVSDATGAPLEPLAADPREQADGKRLAKLKLIAGLTGLELDQLVRRDLVRERKRQSLYLSLAGVVLVLAAGFFWNWQAQKREAASNLSLVNFVSSKWDQFREFGLPLEMIISLANEPLAYLKEKGTSRLDAEGKKAFAVLLRQQGIAYMDQYDYATSLALFQESSDLLTGLSNSADADDDIAYEIALGHYWLGVNRFYVGDYEAAIDPIIRYSDTMVRLYTKNPNNPLFIRENIDSKTLLFELKRRSPESLPQMNLDTQLQRVLDAAETGYRAQKQSPEILDAFLTAHEYAMVYHMASCNVNRALPLIERSQSAALEAVDIEDEKYGATGLERLKDRAIISSSLGNMYLNAGFIPLAKQHLVESYLLRQRVFTQDPTNEWFKQGTGQSQITLFRLSFMGLQNEEMTPLEQSLFEDINTTVRRSIDESVNLEQARLLALAEKHVAVAEISKAEETLHTLFSLLAEEDPNSPRYAGYAARAYWLASAANMSADIPQAFKKADLANQSGNCLALFSLWSWHLANGNTAKADAIASELWSKGYKHPRMGFYARLAGATFPSAGISEQ